MARHGKQSDPHQMNVLIQRTLHSVDGARVPCRLTNNARIISALDLTTNDSVTSSKLRREYEGGADDGEVEEEEVAVEVDVDDVDVGWEDEVKLV